jgi:hypothetical protein
METILLIITVVALLIALVMSVVAARVSREERLRSSARIAALSAAAGITTAAPAVDVKAEEPRRAPWAPRPSAARAIGFDMARENKPAPAVVEAAEAIPIQRGGLTIEPTPAAPLIEMPLQQGFLGGAPVVARSSNGGQKFLAVAASILFVVLAGGFIWQSSNSQESAASAAVVTDTPLELVSMRHDRAQSKLTVSGLVRNPVAGKPVDHLSAVVFLFDSEGTFVTSAKSVVDFVRLASGDESPFVVTLDAPATVARYRVSFRTDEGIVPHIDRRGSPLVETAGLTR